MSGVAVTRTTLGAAVPRSWAQAIVLARYQLRDYLRAFRFVLMMGMVAVVGVILTALLLHYRPPELVTSASRLYGGLWAGGATFVMIIAVIIYGGDAIAGEFQNRTGYFLLGLPVRRAAVYAGKFLAAFAASVVALLFYLVIVVANGVYFLGAGAVSDPAQLTASFGLALLYMLAVLGTAFLFSSLFKQSLYGVLVVLVLFLFGWSLMESVVVGLGHIEPWFIVSYASPVISYPLTGAPEHVLGSGRFAVYQSTLVEGIAIMVGYFLVTTLAGLFLFEHEEFT